MRNAAMICLAAAIVTALVFQGTMLHLLLVIIVMELMIAPMLVVLAAIGIVNRVRQRKFGPDYRRCCVLLGFVAAFAVISYILGLGVLELRLTATRQYVTSCFADLDDTKRRTGKYPAQLPSSESIVRTLTYPVEYSSDGNDFRLSIGIQPE